MSNILNDNIYFDVAATTPLDDNVINIMDKINKDNFGNPSSIHQLGQKSHNILERSRKKMSSLLGCHESELLFTSGGTEANNIAIAGIAEDC